MKAIISANEHYDILIDQDNDQVCDPEELREYNSFSIRLNNKHIKF